MDNRTILTKYILSADATSGSIVYQPCDGLIEVCKSEETKRELLDLVNRSAHVSAYAPQEDSAYSDLVNWAQEGDVLLEASEGVLFCLPK